MTFPVPAGSVIKRYAVSLTARTQGGFIYPTSVVRLRFPDGTGSYLEWWYNNDAPTADYHFEFNDGPPVGTSAVGAFRLEAETELLFIDTLVISEWLAELLIE